MNREIRGPQEPGEVIHRLLDHEGDRVMVTIPEPRIPSGESRGTAMTTIVPTENADVGHFEVEINTAVIEDGGGSAYIHINSIDEERAGWTQGTATISREWIGDYPGGKWDDWDTYPVLNVDVEPSGQLAEAHERHRQRTGHYPTNMGMDLDVGPIVQVSDP